MTSHFQYRIPINRNTCHWNPGKGDNPRYRRFSNAKKTSGSKAVEHFLAAKKNMQKTTKNPTVCSTHAWAGSWILGRGFSKFLGNFFKATLTNPACRKGAASKTCPGRARGANVDFWESSDLVVNFPLSLFTLQGTITYPTNRERNKIIDATLVPAGRGYVIVPRRIYATRTRVRSGDIGFNLLKQYPIGSQSKDQGFSGLWQSISCRWFRPTWKTWVKLLRNVWNQHLDILLRCPATVVLPWKSTTI